MPEPAETAHETTHSINPFSKAGSHTNTHLRVYRTLTALSYILVLTTSIIYTVHVPEANSGPGRHTIWGQNSAHHTPFALNSIIVSIYWIQLYILQIYFLTSLWSSSQPSVTTSLGLAPHFTAHNLLLFAFIMTWVRAHFWPALLLLVLNFANLSMCYFRHPKTARALHVGIVAGPLAWNFVGLYWVGAAAVGAHGLVARILANVAVWGFLGYGMFFLVAYKDWMMGVEMSVLCAALGVSQFLTHVIALQWIFAFVIMGILFLFSAWVGLPHIFGGEPFKRGAVVNEDSERQPLLREE